MERRMSDSAMRNLHVSVKGKKIWQGRATHSGTLEIHRSLEKEKP